MDLRSFRNPKLVRQVVKDLSEYRNEVKIMEVCGTHTMAIGKWGIRKLIPENIKLISGPGCPVCVTPSSVIDELINLEGVTIASFGDLLRLPGSIGNLEQARAKGLDVHTIYSPLEALELSKQKETLFVGIGFETTIPGIAYTISEAHRLKLTDFSVLSLGKLIAPALDALLSDKQIEIDGFILPGHVSVITGTDAYSFMPEKYRVGGVVTGFEPLDIVVGIQKLLGQMTRPQIINEYSRAVTKKGNQNAQAMIERIFEVSNAFWRGLGKIPSSGLIIRDEYSQFDASKKYGLMVESPEVSLAACQSAPASVSNVSANCRCGDILKGKIIPIECALFNSECTPDNPLGPCMVSSEGSCAAYYLYERGYQ